MSKEDGSKVSACFLELFLKLLLELSCLGQSCPLVEGGPYGIYFVYSFDQVILLPHIVCL